MKPMIRLALPLLLVFGLSSCATLFSGPTTSVSVYRNQPTRLITGIDTTREMETETRIKVPHSVKPLTITAFNDTAHRTVFVRPKNSWLFWLNAYPGYTFIYGFVVDHATQRRWKYPSKVYIDLRLPDSTFEPYDPVPDHTDRYSLILKATPQRILGVLHPGVDVMLEKLLSKRFSVELSSGALITPLVPDIARDVRGFRAGLAGRYYFLPSAPRDGYLGIGMEYSRERFISTETFLRTSMGQTSTYSETFGVQKEAVALELRTGCQMVQKRFVLDSYIGVAVRFRNAFNTGRSSPADPPARAMAKIINDVDNRPGSYFTAYPLLNIKLGYLLD